MKSSLLLLPLFSLFSCTYNSPTYHRDRRKIMIETDQAKYKKDTTDCSLHGKVHFAQMFYYDSYNLDSSSTGYKIKEYCEFDQAGNMIRYSNFTGAMNYQQVLSYNSQNMFDQITTTNATGQQIQHEIYRYDSCGRIMEMIVQRPDTLDKTVTYSYDHYIEKMGHDRVTEGKQTLHLIKTFDHDSIVLEEFGYCTYTDNKDTAYGGLTVIKRDINGRLTELSSYDQGKVLSQQILKEYNDKGQPIKLTTTKGSSTTVVSYNYEAHGLISEEWTANPVSGLTTINRKYEYIFDEHGNWKWAIAYDADNRIVRNTIRYITYY